MSLRWRLTAAISALVIAAIAILGVVTTRSVTRSLEDRIDFQLRAFRATPEPRGGDRPQPVPDDELIAPEFDNPAAIVIEFDRDLRVRDSTPNDVEDDPDRPEVDPAQLLTQRNDPNLALTVDAVDGSRRYRIVLSPNPRDGVTVYALPLDDLDATVEQLRERFLVGGAVVVLLVIAAIWWVTKRALRPVDDMVAAADQIGAGRLDARIPTESTIPEVSTLGASLNAMLTEIELSSREREEANQRLRQFVADASHELRTPVATVLGYVELYESGATIDEDGTRRAMDRIGTAGRRLERLVEDLLTLTRLDEGRQRTVQTVDVAELVRDLTLDASVAHVDHHFTYHPAEHRRRVVGDPDLLAMAVSNLLRNAAVHTPPGSTVDVSVSGFDDTVRVSVSDDGPGVPEQELELIFRRFHRSDEGRATRGSGLGLAIVASIAEAHGGSATASRSPADGLCISLDLPSAPDER